MTSRSRHHHRPHLVSLSIALVLTWVSFSPDAFAHAQSPMPVGGFAICQTPSSLHIQGGIGYSDDATYLKLSNQHFRLDLSQAFSASTPPTWANLTSSQSPYQAYHSGACTPDQQSFLTVGNPMESSGAKTGFMKAYSVTKGSWSTVSQVSNNPEHAGRTMVGFAINTNKDSTSGKGLVLGGGLLKLTAATASRPPTQMTGYMTNIDLVAVGGDGSVDSLAFTPQTTAQRNENNLLGVSAGTNIVLIPGENGGATRALVLGGLSSESKGISFSGLPIIDLTTGQVTIRVAQAENNASIPSPRYGHCAALASDGNRVIMYGGAAPGSDKPLDEVHVLDIQKWSWSQPSIKGRSPGAMRNHQCIVVGNQLITLLGFNQNGVPRSASGNAAPPISILTTNQWTWRNNFTPEPNTPQPPAPPTDPDSGDSGGGPNGLAIGFGVVFSLAFLSVIVYSVWAHQKRKLKKREMLLLVELDRRKKEVDEEKKKAEKLQQQQQEQQEQQQSDSSHQRESQVNLVGSAYHAQYNHHNYGAQEYNPYYATTMAPPATSAPYQHTQYAHHDMYQQHAPPSSMGYASAHPYSVPPPPPAAYSQAPAAPQMAPPNPDNSYIPEEMGSNSYDPNARPAGGTLAPHPHYAGAYHDPNRY